MTYQLPSPSINQVFIQPSQALTSTELIPCIIGPLKQVIRAGSIALTYPVSSETIFYPGLKPGAVIETSSVSITIVNAIIEIVGTTVAGANFVAGTNTVVVTDGFLSAAVGDIVTLSAHGGTYTIQEVVSKDSAIFNETIKHTTSAETFTVTRIVPSATVTLNGVAYGTTSMTVTSISYGGKDVVGGSSASMHYIALRKDLLGFYEVNSLDQLAIDMDIDTENPIGQILGVYQPGIAAQTTMAYIVADDVAATYIAALSVIAARRGLYFLYSLSMNSSVQAALASNVTASSAPAESIFRSALVTAPLSTELSLVDDVTYTVT